MSETQEKDFGGLYEVVTIVDLDGTRRRVAIPLDWVHDLGVDPQEIYDNEGNKYEDLKKELDSFPSVEVN